MLFVEIEPRGCISCGDEEGAQSRHLVGVVRCGDEIAVGRGEFGACGWVCVAVGIWDFLTGGSMRCWASRKRGMLHFLGKLRLHLIRKQKHVLSLTRENGWVSLMRRGFTEMWVRELSAEIVVLTVDILSW